MRAIRILLHGGAVMWSLVFVLLAAAALPLQAHAANSAEAFVQSNIEKGYAILHDDASSAAQRQQEFRVLLVSIVDVKRVALFTLGPYARGAAQDDIDRFVAAFTDYLMAVYYRGLDRYKDRALEVTGSTERAKDDVIVSLIAGGRNESSALRVAFRVRQASSGGLIVTDLQIEGAWLALIQRAEFTAYLQQHRGSIAELSMELERRATQPSGSEADAPS